VRWILFQNIIAIQRYCPHSTYYNTLETRMLQKAETTKTKREETTLTPKEGGGVDPGVEGGGEDPGVEGGGDEVQEMHVVLEGPANEPAW